jgi:DUF4097 and DUF4098 domain-containing protein YvlB
MSSKFGAVSVFSAAASEYKIETDNGAITLDGGRGPLWLHSSFGDIEVRSAQDATLDLVTSNGKVTFQGSLSTEADHLVESNFGAVLLRLPSDTAVTLDASTDFGRIRVGQDPQRRHHHRSRTIKLENDTNLRRYNYGNT